ncbi:MAG TPA: 2OG-Fe dioxygenase family protein [Usitatibacter sp.]|jgi:hypothetical protein|nr:2OG-Fe dioxygenase family protein [Usitatibacter sp.]
MTGLERLAETIAASGYAWVPAAGMGDVLGALPDWDAFAASWDDMPRDEHLPEGHRYRRRRHATLSARAGRADFRIEPHQPHYQSLDYNTLVGGIERWFEPMRLDTLESATFRAVAGFCLRLFGALRPGADWHIECHQFRIEARPEAAGLPTPEGVHRDGVDYVLVLLVSRVNIESGTTTVHDQEGRQLGHFTLAAPLDAALVDDARVKHGVTAVRPLDPALEAHRDVLVVTLREIRAT